MGAGTSRTITIWLVFSHVHVSGSDRLFSLDQGHRQRAIEPLATHSDEEKRHMKIWSTPAVHEQNVGLEVTSYLPADIDLV
jgi:coenzyme PQQ precursor peptide PqqA